MSSPTPAQEEFSKLVENKAPGDSSSRAHPEDRDAAAKEYRNKDPSEDQDEEDQYRDQQIETALGMATLDARNGAYSLPTLAFDSGRFTGVKGVIADARSYEMARRGKWKERVRAASRSVFGMDQIVAKPNAPAPDSDGSVGDDHDDNEESFLAQWRETRRKELEEEGWSMPARSRRTSPSLRLFGRMDEVDALGYLDAIEKVGRDTVVVVFVYDQECDVSKTAEKALRPLVVNYPTVHFVKVHYEDFELDNAGVPAILAYKNQGDLFANLTGLYSLLADDEEMDTEPLRRLFKKHGIL